MIDVRTALGSGWRLRLGGDPAAARPQLVIVEEPCGVRGRPRDPETAGVEAVAPARRQRRRARDRLPERTESRSADGRVAGDDGKLREEQADARDPVVEIRLERAVLQPPRQRRVDDCTGPVAAVAVPDRVVHDTAGDRRRRGSRNATSEDMPSRERRLAVGSVDLNALLREAGDHRIDSFADPRHALLHGRARSRPRGAAQRRTPKLSPLPSASASPTPEASSSVKAGTRGARWTRSASATSSSVPRSAREAGAGQVEHGRVAAIQPDRMIGDLQSERRPRGVEPRGERADQRRRRRRG